MKLVVSLFIIGVFCTLPIQLSGQNGLKGLEFFLGNWELTTLDAQPTQDYSRGVARTHAHYILGKRAIQDDFYQIDPTGDTLYVGTSIRSFNRRTQKYQITWLMPGQRGITEIEAEWKEGKLVSEGEGYDGGGKFLERFEYYDIEENSYKFTMDRSYDGGKTWISPFSQFKATRKE